MPPIVDSIVNRALEALLTDPVTGTPLDDWEIASLAYGLTIALAMIVIMIALSLALGPGQ